MYIIFDTETTGLPRNWNAPITDTDNWPRVVQIAWQLHDEMGRLIESKDYLIQPEGYDIPYDAEAIHGISTELAQKDGVSLEEALVEFNDALLKAKFVVGQNVKFDTNVTRCEFHRLGIETPMNAMSVLDTCTETTAKLCMIPGGRGGRFKLPTLTELHEFLFQEKFNEAHNATADVEATTRCFLELIRRGVFLPEELQQEERYIEDFKGFNPKPIGLAGIEHLNLKAESAKLVQSDEDVLDIDKDPERNKIYKIPGFYNHPLYTIYADHTEKRKVLAP